MGKLLIKNGLVIDVENKEKTGIKDILIENDNIVKIDTNIIDKEANIIDAKNNIVMPGLINTHNHVAMNFFRGYAEGLNLMDWLNKKIWPVEDKLMVQDVYESSRAGILEMIKSGTTTFLDMYFLVDGTIKAVNESGIRACISRCIMNTENDDDIRIKETLELIEKYNYGQNDLITLMVGPHSPYVCDDMTLKRCVKLAKDNNIGIHIHVAETKDEIDIIRKKYNLTPVELLNKCGVFEVPVVLAHGIWVSKEDMEILKNNKCTISHNPVSNAKLGSGIAPICDYIQNDINISLGTDGACSTSSLDMFLEMKLANYMQKAVKLDSTALDAFKTLQMATINGAKALCMEDKIGSIKVGKKADIIILDGKNINLNPLNDVYANIVYSAFGNDVITSIINGKVVMENRKLLTLDEQDVIKKCNDVARKLL